MNYGLGNQTSAPNTTSLAQGRTDTPPESESKIRNVVTMAEELLGSLHASISHLESRLDTVLTPIPPSPAGATAVQQNVPAMSHVLSRGAQVNYGLQDAISRLNALRDRVEV